MTITLRINVRKKLMNKKEFKKLKKKRPVLKKKGKLKHLNKLNERSSGYRRLPRDKPGRKLTVRDKKLKLRQLVWPNKHKGLLRLRGMLA